MVEFSKNANTVYATELHRVLTVKSARRLGLLKKLSDAAASIRGAL